MISNKDFFFFSGKGGVGKTTTSSAVSLLLSRKGFKTLLVSLDPAHSLSHAFKINIGGSEKEISPNLFGLEVDIKNSMHSYLENIKQKAKQILSPIVLDEVKAQIDLAYESPGAFELAIVDILYSIVKDKGKFDKIVFDTAPSGYTLRLVAMPKTFYKWMDKLIDLRRKGLSMQFYANLKEKRNIDDLINSDPVLNILLRRRREFEILGNVIKGPRTFFALVTNPGSLPTKITEDAISGLRSCGISVDAIFLNKAGESDKVKFKGQKVIPIPGLQGEAVGIKNLEELSRYLENVL